MKPNQDRVPIEAQPASSQADPPLPRTVAHKFGGSSVADAARYRHVAELLLKRPEQTQITVVSAIRGVTARELLRANGAPTLDWLDGQFDELAEICHALSVLGTVPRETLELVQGLGEIFSARLLSAHLRALGQDCVMLDARDVLVTEPGGLGVTVDWWTSRELLAAWRIAHAELHIWTDVDGVLSADPRLVPEAKPLRALSYQEACELTYFGARIVHPQTMIPAMTRGLPILVRNSFRPEHPGTRIARGIPPATTALRAAHAGFWLSAESISLGVIGKGKVGRALLEQLARAIPRLRRDADLDVRLRALADRTRTWLDDQGGVEGWEDRLARGAPCDLEGFARHLQTAHWPHAVIIDCSASDAVASCYAAWLAAGIHVITPNKKAGAGPLERYRRMRAAQVKSGSRFRYEATVGAGLPVISTLRDLLDTGDDLLAIEGVLSGTLSFLFNRFNGEQRFSALLREARAFGLTEPDPRDDLAGSDVARKLTILAREAGRDLEVEQVSVENLVPETLRAASREEFFARLEELDSGMEKRLAGARAHGSVLRHVARLDQEGARVELVEVPTDHTFARLRLSENMVRFTTRRYRESPLVVQGPGGGPEVTAAGVFADLLRVAAALGARV